MSTAVWMVMCSEPVMRAPASGWLVGVLGPQAMRPGISCSASWISLRPKAARDRSATLKSPIRGVVMGVPPWARRRCERALGSARVA
jgi:hypothetical protein